MSESMGKASPPETRATERTRAQFELRPTHLQVKELAVPPVDGLGGGVRPGHVDDVYLWGKSKSR